MKPSAHNINLENFSKEFIKQGINYYICQSSNIATIKCSNRNIFVNINALERSEYFRKVFYKGD